jgi:aminoglycoside phosphotransferase (APT) family kinase protein
MPEASTAPVAADLQEAARRFFPDLTAVEPIAGHPDIVRVTNSGEQWGVRRWPEGTPARDLAFSHEVMAAASAAGITEVPRPVAAPGADDAGLHIAGRLYGARSWLPGAPPPRAEAVWPGADDRIDLPVTLPRSTFSEVISAVAGLHTASERITALDAPAAPLGMLPGAVRQAQTRHLRALRARARREPAIQRWLATGERLIGGAETIVLAAAQDGPLPETALHLGLWPSHVLLENSTLRGLLGWERVAIGSPLLDLAQATLRLHGWSDETVEAALGVYGEQRQLSPEERRLLPAVAALDAVATTGRLLEQTYAVAETARPPTALRAAIDLMLRSLSALDRDLAAQATIGKRRKAVWRRGPRPPARREGGRPRERRR